MNGQNSENEDDSVLEQFTQLEKELNQWSQSSNQRNGCFSNSLTSTEKEILYMNNELKKFEKEFLKSYPSPENNSTKKMNARVCTNSIVTPIICNIL